MGKLNRNLSRKERRKKERQVKKEKKCAYFMKKNMKKDQVKDEVKTQLVEKENKDDKVSMKLLKKKKKQMLREEKEITRVKEIRKKQLEEDNEREDKNIRMLEKKMKLNRNKKKKLPKSFFDDGLSYILEACDSETVKNLEPEMEFADKDDFEADEMEEMNNTNETEDSEPESKVAKPSKKKVRWQDEVDDVDMATGEDEESGDSDERNEFSEEDDNSDEEMDVTEENLDLSEDEVEEETKKDEINDDEFWEDVYGRKRDKEGKIVSSQSEGKYIPPSKRIAATDSEKLVKLRKQLKGLLNRLSEGNMKTIASQIEDLYLNNSRNDMNETLGSLVFTSIVQFTLTPDRLVEEHAMLIALLHADIGSEVGAHFLQMLVVKFNELYSKEVKEENKEIHNVLLLLANLYNFKVVHSLLMFNLLQLLTEKFSTIDLELILLLLKSIGFVLRKDDPTNLKDIVLKIQSKAHESAQGENESRVRFMLETVMAIKNNNMTKIPNYDPSHMDHLRKLLRSLVRKGCYVVELRISLDDLLNAETKGRWWIVGSSWSGDQFAKSEDNNKSNEVKSTAQIQVNEKILELARKQRMNTDIRRNIFCIIMTAEDFIDCFEKLMKLGLQAQQEREIVHVIINCCMNETKFNPYYAHLAAKFCVCDRRFQMAFQYALWDRFKELNNMKKTQSSNIAEFLASLFTTQNLSISILKVIQFSEMNKHLVSFLRLLLIRVLIHDDFRIVFQKINPSPKLRMFREGLHLFLRHFILRQKNKLDIANAELIEERINEAEKILLTADLVVRL